MICGYSPDPHATSTDAGTGSSPVLRTGVWPSASLRTLTAWRAAFERDADTALRTAARWAADTAGGER